MYEYGRMKWHECRKFKVTRTATAEQIVRTLTNKPQTTFARLLRSSVRIPSIADNEGEEHRQFVQIISRAVSEIWTPLPTLY